MMKDTDVIVVIFSKEQVRRCKLAHFIKQFGRDALPLGPALAELMNRLRFSSTATTTTLRNFTPSRRCASSINTSTESGPTGSISATCNRKPSLSCVTGGTRGYGPVAD